MLAEMAINVEMGRLITYKSAWEVEQGRRNSYWASIAKAHCADMANKSAADAVQVKIQNCPIKWVFLADGLIPFPSSPLPLIFPPSPLSSII